jgi:hypothetical protein
MSLRPRKATTVSDTIDFSEKFLESKNKMETSVPVVDEPACAAPLPPQIMSKLDILEKQLNEMNSKMANPEEEKMKHRVMAKLNDLETKLQSRSKMTVGSEASNHEEIAKSRVFAKLDALESKIRSRASEPINTTASQLQSDSSHVDVKQRVMSKLDELERRLETRNSMQVPKTLATAAELRKEEAKLKHLRSMQRKLEVN